MTERVKAILRAARKIQPSLESQTTFEKHYRPEQLAEIWSVDASTVRRWFRGTPGVLRRGRCVCIPESVAHRRYAELQG